MTRNINEELDNLLLRSQRLSSFDPSRYLNRRFAEISEGSNSLINESSTSNSLLFNLSSQVDSHNYYEGTSISGFLAHHNDMVISTSILEAKRDSKKFSKNLQNEWIKSEWSHSMESFINSLGHRARLLNMSSQLSLASNSSMDLDRPSTPAEAPLMLMTPPNYPVSTPSSSSITTTSFMPASQVVLPPETVKGIDLEHIPKILESHLPILEELNNNSNMNIYPCLKLEKTMKKLENLINPAEKVAYLSLLSMLSFMVGEKSSSDRMTFTTHSCFNETTTKPPSAGQFSLIPMDLDDINDKNLYESLHEKLNNGGLIYFQEIEYENLERKYYDIIKNTAYNIDQNSFLSQIQLICACNYEELLRENKEIKYYTMNIKMNRENNTSQFNEKNLCDKEFIVPCWTVIYYCLRLGRFDTAMDQLLMMRPEENGVQEMKLILKIITHYFKKRKNINNQLINSFATPEINRNLPTDNEIINDCKKLNEYFDKLKKIYIEENLKKSSKIDPYFTHLLNLIAQIDKRDLAGASLPNYSFEDFIWSHLFFIDINRLLGLAHPVKSEFKSPFKSPVDKVKPNNFLLENDFLELIYAYGGPTYFDKPTSEFAVSNPYKFSFLMFACHRYGDAIAHLWLNNKKLIALNLTIACKYYGLLHSSQALIQSPSHSLVSSYYGQFNSTGKAIEISINPYNIVDNFFNDIEEKLKESNTSKNGYYSSFNFYLTQFNYFLLSNNLTSISNLINNKYNKKNERIINKNSSDFLFNLFTSIPYHCIVSFFDNSKESLFINGENVSETNRIKLNFPQDIIDNLLKKLIEYVGRNNPDKNVYNTSFNYCNNSLILYLFMLKKYEDIFIIIINQLESIWNFNMHMFLKKFLKKFTNDFSKNFIDYINSFTNYDYNLATNKKKFWIELVKKLINYFTNNSSILLSSPDLNRLIDQANLMIDLCMFSDEIFISKNYSAALQILIKLNILPIENNSQLIIENKFLKPEILNDIILNYSIIVSNKKDDQIVKELDNYLKSKTNINEEFLKCINKILEKE